MTFQNEHPTNHRRQQPQQRRYFNHLTLNWIWTVGLVVATTVFVLNTTVDNNNDNKGREGTLHNVLDDPKQYDTIRYGLRENVYVEVAALKKEYDGTFVKLQEGYQVLNDVLWGTSHLWLLKDMRRILFHTRSVEDVRIIMDTTSSIGQRRSKELQYQRQLEPNMSKSATYHSPGSSNSGMKSIGDPIGDAMNDIMRDKVIAEMMDRSHRFDLNFVLTQLQACRLIMALCRGIKTIEVNEERLEWLEDTAIEYEEFRKEIFNVIVKYVTNNNCDSGVDEN